MKGNVRNWKILNMNVIAPADMVEKTVKYVSYQIHFTINLYVLTYFGLMSMSCY